jgi:colanic acid biosynthesis glycosyl transferase WcaI
MMPSELRPDTSNTDLMRILVLNQYFHPDLASTGQLLTELCEDLAEHHDVTVVAGRPSYDPIDRGDPRGLVHEEMHGKVRVLRPWSTSFPRRNMAGRLSNYATYLVSSMACALKATRPDVILTMTDPPIVAAAAMLAGRLRRVPYVYVCQDIFPEVGVVLGHLRNPGLVKGLGALNRALRRRAAAVVTIGRDMEDRLLALGAPPDRITVIPNWTDGSLIRPLEGPSPLREEQGWGDRFVVMHSGNVGLSQSLETLIDAATLLRDQEDISFAIIGEGAAKAGLQRRVKGRDLRNVVFLPYQEKESLSVSLGAADVHYVGLRRGLAGFIVPSKVYGILAAGKPFIAAVDADAEPARIALEDNCGLVVEPDDAAALADAILRVRREPLEVMGGRARAAFEKRFDRPVATDAYRRLLERAAKS